MSFIRAVFRQYWSHILAIAVFVLAAKRYWHLGNRLDEGPIIWICAAATGLLLVLQGIEYTIQPLSDSERLTKDPHWMRRRVYTYRSVTGPIVGGVMLIGGTIALYRL